MSANYLQNGLHWKEWNKSALEAWISLILHTILCIIILILISVYIHIFLCNKWVKSTDKMESKHKTTQYYDKWLKILLFISFMFALLYIFASYFIACIVILVFNIRYQYHCLYRVLCASFVALQKASVHVFMIIRLRSFEGTAFELGKIKSRIIIYVVLIMNAVTLSFLIYFARTEGLFFCNIYGRNLGYVIIVGASGDIIVSSLLTYIFVWRLKAMFTSKSRKNDTITINVKYLFQKFTVLS